MIDLVFLAIGAAVCIVGMVLTNLEVRRGRRDAVRAIMKTDETARAAWKTVRDSAKRALELKRDIAKCKKEITVLETGLSESKVRLDHPETRRSWVLVLGERRTTTSEIPYAVEVRDTRTDERQVVMIWEENKDRAAQRVGVRFSAAAGFEVVSTESLRSPPPPVNT